MEDVSLRRELFHYARNGDRHGVKRILEQYPQLIDAVDSKGCTPILSACAHGHMKVAVMLAEKGANINAKDKNMRTALHYACAFGRLDVATLLTEKDADLNLKEKNGWTPFHLACDTGSTTVASLLADKGANINIQDNHGYTALHYACAYARSEIATLLVEKGALTTICENEGRTAIELTTDTALVSTLASMLASREQAERSTALLLEQVKKDRSKRDGDRSFDRSSSRDSHQSSLTEPPTAVSDGVTPLSKSGRGLARPQAKSTATGASLSPPRRPASMKLERGIVLNDSGHLPPPSSVQAIAVLSRRQLETMTDRFASELQVDAEKETSGTSSRQTAASSNNSAVPASSLFYGSFCGAPVVVRRYGLRHCLGLESSRATASTQHQLRVLREVHVLSACQHVHLQPLLGVCVDPSCVCLVYPQAESGSLQDVLNDADLRQGLSAAFRLRIAAAVCSVLSYLHTPNEASGKPWCIVHRSIRPSKVLLTGDSILLAGLDACAMVVDDSDTISVTSFETESSMAVAVADGMGGLGYLDPLYNETGYCRLPISPESRLAYRLFRHTAGS